MDTLSLNQMTFYGKHGVYPGEKEKPQPFMVDVELYLDLSHASVTDHLTDSVDYKQVYFDIRTIIETHTYNLIERIAGEIATTLLSRYPIHSLKVTLQKRFVEDFMGNGFPRVEIIRSKPVEDILKCF